MDTRELTPGDRRELRALVKKQFEILRKEVKNRKDELTGEIESELLRRYRQTDERIAQARLEIEAARRTYEDTCRRIMGDLRAMDPDLELSVGYQGGLNVGNTNRTQMHRALIASIPQQIADASTKLDQQELTLLRDLTLGALDSEAALQFLQSIPTVGELVPKARLPELES
jgi:hypothetical protein